MKTVSSVPTAPCHLQHGKQAEQLALRYLRRKGLTLLEKNFRCKCGEIDLIMQDGITTVFVEVRHRRNTRFGNGFDSINHSKQQKIIRTAQRFLQQHPQRNQHPCRFDVISSHGQDFQICWLKDAIFLE